MLQIRKLERLALKEEVSLLQKTKTSTATKQKSYHNPLTWHSRTIMQPIQ